MHDSYSDVLVVRPGRGSALDCSCCTPGTSMMTQQHARPLDTAPPGTPTAVQVNCWGISRYAWFASSWADNRVI